MINRDFESIHFRANINGDYFFIRELDENKMGGKVIDGNAKGKNWEEKMEKILCNCCAKRMTFAQAWESVIGNCKNLTCRSY